MKVLTKKRYIVEHKEREREREGKKRRKIKIMTERSREAILTMCCCLSRSGWNGLFRFLVIKGWCKIHLTVCLNDANCIRRFCLYNVNVIFLIVICNHDTVPSGQAGIIPQCCLLAKELYKKQLIRYLSFKGMTKTIK